MTSYVIQEETLCKKNVLIPLCWRNANHLCECLGALCAWAPFLLCLGPVWGSANEEVQGLIYRENPEVLLAQQVKGGSALWQWLWDVFLSTAYLIYLI